MPTRRSFTLGTVATLAAGIAGPRMAAAAETVRIGQATAALSFMPLWAARALDTFAAQGLTASVAVLPGGDPASLAALDAGDIDLAAVGPEAVLRAVAKGQPFQIVSSLMSQVTLQLVVSKAFLDRTGVKPSDPLEKRLAALKGALVGVSAIAGTQDTMARWLASKGGLDPKTGIQVAQVGSPPAIQAALENKRIEAFILSPPEGYIAEARGYGSVLVSVGSDFPDIARQPYLVLVAKTPVPDAVSARITATLRALQAASAELVAKPEETGRAIQVKFFQKAEPEAIAAAVKVMKDGVADGGALDAQEFANLFRFSAEVGTSLGKDYDAASSENTLWTNRYVAAAKAR